MRKGDEQIGLPAAVYNDTAANIEALTGVAEGAVAYATDTDELGTYDGAAWVWGSGGGYTEGAKVYNNANQSIPNESITALTFNSEYYDTDGIHDNAVNNSRLTCQTAGKYVIIGNFQFASNSTGYRAAWIVLGGATYIAEFFNTAINGNVTTMVIATIYDLEVGNYVVLMCYQGSGGALNVMYNAEVSVNFMMQRIG